MRVLLRRLGEHRGSPRLYLDAPALETAGFTPGTPISLHVDAAECRVTITPALVGARRVSRKLRKSASPLPVIDINSAKDLEPFGPEAVVRIVIAAGAILVLLTASQVKARSRHLRLLAKLASGARLKLAGTAFGAGIASQALHQGLSEGGIECDLVLANEVSETYLELAAARNPTIASSTALAAVPMQEAALDDNLLQHVGPVEILEAGIPCSGASKAGVAKRALMQMEDHPDVGHLVAATIQLIAALQPAIVFVENVEPYRHTASAAILRGWLRDAGYSIAEAVLNAREFGSLEARVRWFLVAHPPQLPLDLSAMSPASRPQGTLADVLDPISQDDPRFRPVTYLKEKADRDLDKGNGFGMQLLGPAATSVPVLRKGYHKGGSTDPRLVHPSNPELSRLLTASEHARIKGINPELVAGVPETIAHQVCGQSVDTRPVRAIGRWLATALLVGEAELASAHAQRHASMAAITG